MTNPVVVTGSASGLGAATRIRLAAAGRPTIGVDLQDADVEADLGSAGGRGAAIAEILERAEGALDGVVSCAAVGPDHPDPRTVIRVNWFGAMAMLDGLRPALERGDQPSAVAIASIGAVIGGDDALLELLLAGDEDAAAAGVVDSVSAYSTTKQALAATVRRYAPAWGVLGIRLNAVAPGRMETPMLARLMADPDLAPGIDALPSGVRRSGSADDVAAVVTFLLGADAGFVHGQVLYVDGGCEAIIRPEVF